MSAFEHTIESVVRGFHVYKDAWVPVLHTVAVIKTTSSDEVTVGHVPQSISRMCWYFIQHDREITCKVTGRRRRSDLPQGGLEVPCKYKFMRIKKICKLLK